MTDRQILEIFGRRLLNDDGTPAAPSVQHQPDPTAEEAKGQFITFCMAFLHMTPEQAEAAYQERLKAGGAQARGEVP
jgi:hypothetical protein